MLSIFELYCVTDASLEICHRSAVVVGPIISNRLQTTSKSWFAVYWSSSSVHSSALDGAELFSHGIRIQFNLL